MTTLPNPMKDWVEAQTLDGQYANASDYVRDLIRKDKIAQEKKEILIRALIEGEESGVSDHTIDDIWKDVKARYTNAKLWVIKPKKAERDVTGILEYSHKEFGEKIALDYYLSLKKTFVLLSEQPQIGRDIENIRAGYFCHEHAKHTIYYAPKENSILIIRVLHQNMDFKRHL